MSRGDRRAPIFLDVEDRKTFWRTLQESSAKTDRQLGRIALVKVWFELRDGRRMCLPRITQPESAQAVLLAQLNWTLPQQPPSRVYAREVAAAETTLNVAEVSPQPFCVADLRPSLCASACPSNLPPNAMRKSG